MTIGYARKSSSGESTESRTRLLQDMVNILHSKDLCQGVYILPLCNADSPLTRRDKENSDFTKEIMGNLRFVKGDFQGNITT